MSKIKCKLISRANSSFLQQIYTGFFLLVKTGLIDLEQIVVRGDGKNEAINHHHNIRVILNKDITLHYDLEDGCEINQNHLDGVRYYFKRSYYPPYLNTIGKQKEKVFPLGLNYPVVPSDIDMFALKRYLILASGKKKIGGALRALNLFNGFLYEPRVNRMHALPDYDAEPNIIFMVKAYDPYDKPGRPLPKTEERIQINETRAECIKLLRSEFGSRFYGGFYHNAISMQQYPDCLMPEKSASQKENYIRLLKKYPICVANSGLHGSIGWKFAEYIAFSKAIIAEKMNYQVPGNIENGKNYLEFATPEDCVENAVKLFHDQELRYSMMTNNLQYYLSYLRPDVLILNTLLTALSEENKV